jgi:hypothetical protein
VFQLEGGLVADGALDGREQRGPVLLKDVSLGQLSTG